jgi:hypothetical protein
VKAASGLCEQTGAYGFECLHDEEV